MARQVDGHNGHDGYDDHDGHDGYDGHDSHNDYRQLLMKGNRAPHPRSALPGCGVRLESDVKVEKRNSRVVALLYFLQLIIPWLRLRRQPLFFFFETLSILLYLSSILSYKFSYLYCLLISLPIIILIRGVNRNL